MKNLLYYFYLLCFVAMAICCIFYFVVDDEFIGFIVLMQLIWGPISIVHCLVKFLQTRRIKATYTGLYTISLIITIAYFLILTLVASSGVTDGFANVEVLFIVGIGVIPWSMLAFFTYILHLEKNTEKGIYSIEDTLIEETN